MFIKRGILAALVAFATFSGANAACGPIDGTVQDAGGEACVCESGNYGADCESPLSCAANLPDPERDIIDTGSFIPTAETRMSDDNTSVLITILIPGMKTRTYRTPNLTIQNCAAGNPATPILSSFEVVQNPSMEPCYDQWDLGILVNRLEPCGFTVTTEDIDGEAYERYSGSITYQYQEKVTLSDDVGVAGPQDRNVQVLLPITFNFKTEYGADLVVDNLTVFSEVVLDAALVGQRISIGSTTSDASLSYGVQYPYEVKSMKTQVQKMVNGVATVGMVTEMYLTSDTDFETPLGDADMPECTGTAANTGDYTVGAKATCVKTLNILWYHADNCVMNGEYRIEDVSIQCGVDILPVDCPLQTPSPAYIDFTLNSENFCPDTGSNNVIDNAVTITSFLAPPLSQLLWTEATGDTVQQNAWTWGRPFFMRFHFAGLTVTAVELTQVQTAWAASGTPADSPTDSYVATGALPTGIDGLDAVNAPPALGLHIDSQGFLFYAPSLDTSFIVDGTEPERGEGVNLAVSVRFSISYQNVRRRRRQADAGTNGKASASLPPQTITAADDGSSAVRVAPAVALAIALVSAVALL